MVSAWTALFKKEMRLTGFGFIIFLCLQLLLMGLGVYLDIRYGSYAMPTPAILAIGSIILVMHMFYLPAVLGVNAFFERKTLHLWMHNPLPGWSMLAAKLLSGFIYMTLSFAIIGLYLLIGLIQANVSMPQAMSADRIFQYAVVMTAGIYWIAFCFGILAVFLWIVDLCLKSRIGPLSWIIIVIGLILSFVLIVKLDQIGLIAAITEWGELPSFFSGPPNNMQFSLSGGSFTVSQGKVDDPVYLGSYVLDFVSVSLFFLGSSWLLDHKLEVS